jgi:GNAT superfamily N-acetyltransferase
MTLDPGLTMRVTQPSDFDEVLALIIACDIADLGEPDYDANDLRGDWSEISLEDTSRVVVDGDGRIVGYALAFDRMTMRLTGGVFTHPHALGRGIGTTLTRWMTERAQGRVGNAPEGARVILEFGTHARNTRALDLLANEGFTPHRYMLRMMITFNPEQQAFVSAPPDGVTIDNFRPGEDDYATYDAIEEAFMDHWGHARRPYEEWRRRTVERDTFDASCWFVARAGDRDSGEVAGAAICNDHPELSQGWVGTLGVRRPWRRSGVAMALLYRAFEEFRRRGRTQVGLGVDSESLTGATRVYERAGMRETQRFAMCARELRPGVELTTQELTD